MCRDCGCSSTTTSAEEAHEHVHHHHEHEHHDHLDRRSIAVHESLFAKNDEIAARNREGFHARCIRVINLMSSPGSGKTAILERTLASLAPGIRAAAIVGDLATDNDARRLRTTGVPVYQVETGSRCHLEADMVAHAASHLDLDGVDLLFVENVGNLVCPAAYDLGEDIRVVVASVTEGEDKPLKYPLAYRWSDMVLLNKIDLSAAVDFDRTVALTNIRGAAPNATVFELSAKTGAGFDAWLGFLKQCIQNDLVHS